MHASRSVIRLARSLARTLAFTGAAVLLPLLVVVASFVAITAGPVLPGGPFQRQLQTPAYTGPLPAPVAHDPAKRTALIVAGNTATESSDLLGPYEVLATSGQYNVYVVAPERRLTPLIPVPLCCGALDILPHYSFAAYDRAIGVTPDVVVVPYIPFATDSAADAAVLDWLRDRPGDQTIIVSICGGSQMTADAGLLDGRRATSHHTVLAGVEQAHPETTWERGLRYVDDGRLISSAGVTSGIDASLHLLDREFGRAVALDTAKQMGYPHTRFLDDPTWEFVDVRSGNATAAILPNSFRWDRTQIGLVLYGGVRETALSSVVDTYPRSTVTDVVPIAAERRYLRTANGLDLLPRADLASAPLLDRVLIPGAPAADVTAPIERWVASQGLIAERIHASGDYPYDSTFRDLAQQDTRPIAEYAAAWLEYPTAHLGLTGRTWQPALLLRGAALGALGLVVALSVGLARRQRQQIAPRTAPTVAA